MIQPRPASVGKMREWEGENVPLTVTKFTRRSGVDRGDFGLAALDLCRQYRGTDGVVNARYWWDTASTVAVVVETEPGVPFQSLNNSPDVIRAGFALDDLANPHSFETWGDARGGSDSWEAAGRPSGT